MVRIHPDPPGLQQRRTGAVAQLGERLLCKQEVVGSIPSSSTSSRSREKQYSRWSCRLPCAVALNAGLWKQSPALRAAVFFNNWEGKGSHDLMRVV